MKKLLLVTDAWTPQINGVVRVQDAIIPLLRARGIEVIVVEPSQFRTVPLPTYPEIRVALFARRKMARIIEDARADAVHLMTEGTLGWAARSVCISRGIPFTTWYHSHFPLFVDARLRGVIRAVFAFIRRFHTGAVRTFVSTETLKNELERSGFKNLTVVPLGVDTTFFKRNPNPPLPPLEKPVFVFFSRLAPEKNPDEFFRLNLPGTKLVIGDGPDRKRLEQAHGATHRFVGYKKGQELVDWLSLTDVFVFPSRTETFGLVALEALACGIPVAAHDVMGPRDIVTVGKDGYLGEDLREAALKCLDLSRADCRAKAERFSWEHSVEAFVRNLAEVSESPSTP